MVGVVGSSSELSLAAPQLSRVLLGAPSPQGPAAWANKARALSLQSRLSSQVGQHSRAWARDIPEMRRSEGHPWWPGSPRGPCALGEAPTLAAWVRRVGSGWVLQLRLHPAPSLGAGRTELLSVTSPSARPGGVDVAVMGSR